MLVALDSGARPSYPDSYILDIAERRYGQAPGSALTWDVDALARALMFMSLEASVKVTRS
jgi:hypothetical protein